MEISLSFPFSSSPLFSHSRVLLRVNVTSLDAFHSLLAVSARRYSVNAIYITKWPFLASPPHSSLPCHLFSHHLQLFIFLRECIWAWMKAYIYQRGHLSTYLREKGRFITSYLEWLGGEWSTSDFSQWESGEFFHPKLVCSMNDIIKIHLKKCNKDSRFQVKDGMI